MAGQMTFTPEPASGKLAWKAAQARVKAALAWRRERRIGDRMWKRAKRLHIGDHWAQPSEGSDLYSDLPRDNITVNVTASSVESYTAFLGRVDPEFLLKPTKLGATDWRQNMRKVQALLNQTWSEFGVQEQYELALLDGVLFGHGVMKTGYVLDADFPEAKDPAKQGEIQYSQFIRKDNPYAVRVNPFRFIFDPLASDNTIKTARWVGEVIFRTKQDIVSDSRYKASVISRIRSGEEEIETAKSFFDEDGRGGAEGMIRTAMDLKEDEDLLQAMELGVLFEVVDRKFDKYYVFASGVEEPLIENDRKFRYLDGFNYAMWRFSLIPDEPFSIGAPIRIEDQQLEKNRIRSAAFRHRRKHGVRKVALAQQAMDDEVVTQITDDVTEVVGLPGPPAMLIGEIPSPQLPADNYQVDRMINNDMLEILGLDELQRSGQLKSRTSAREIEARQSVIGTKTAQRGTYVDRFAAEVATQLLKHWQANMRLERVVELMGPEGASFVEVTQDEVREMEFRVRVVSSSREKPDPSTERAQRTSFFGVALQNQEALLAQGYALNLPKLLSWVGEAFDAPDLPEVLVRINPQAPPVDLEGDAVGGVPGIPTSGPGPGVVNANSLEQGARGAEGPVS